MKAFLLLRTKINQFNNTNKHGDFSLAQRNFNFMPYFRIEHHFINSNETNCKKNNEERQRMIKKLEFLSLFKMRVFFQQQKCLYYYQYNVYAISVESAQQYMCESYRERERHRKRLRYNQENSNNVCKIKFACVCLLGWSSEVGIRLFFSSQILKCIH